MELPVLKIQRLQGDQALLDHELTPNEQKLFKEMDKATAGIAEDSNLEAYYAAIVLIGAKYGLNRQQSIAFWTRTTFMLFEP